MRNQAGTFAGLGPVKASGQCDPDKTVRSRYRIGVPGWAPISKACLVWPGIALPEINVIVPQRIHSSLGRRDRIC